MRTYNPYTVIACYLQYFQEIVYHIFLRLSITKKTGSTAGDFLFCTAGFLLVIYFICRQISRKLSTLTYPVTYFPAGVLPQYSLRVVIRKRPSLHCLPS